MTITVLKKTMRLAVTGIAILLSYPCSAQAFADSTMLIRIAEIQIDSNYTAEYHAILQEEASLSMQLEPGVICILPMHDKKNKTIIRILEIYADQQAYESHLKTKHFLKYKEETLPMVKSLHLPDLQLIDPQSLPLIFAKQATSNKGD